jgi:hypothetical protein
MPLFTVKAATRSMSEPTLVNGAERFVAWIVVTLALRFAVASNRDHRDAGNALRYPLLLAPLPQCNWRGIERLR